MTDAIESSYLGAATLLVVLAGAGFGGCAGSTVDQTGGAAGTSSGGTGGTSTGGTGTGGADASRTCATAGDCTWGEIEHDILSPADCICLFGCPGHVQNVTTYQRRQQQYFALCDPNVDGQGNPCPIDECIQPPPLACVEGLCVATAQGA